MVGNLKILILEDVEFDAELIVHEMRREGIDFISMRVETEEEYVNALEDFSPDVVLVDHSLPQFDGVTALEILKEKTPDTPLIFVSGKIGDEFAVDVLKKGAADYVFKNNLSKLVPAIERALKERSELLERRKAEEKLKTAYKDMEVRIQNRTRELSQINQRLLGEIAERKLVEEALNKSIKEKDVLLKEIHHRVKNNLQIVSSLLSLQSQYVNEPGSVELFKESQSRIISMALIHEKLYQTGDLTRINLSEYANELIGDLFRSYSVNTHLMKYQIESKNILLDINTAIPCGLIINELVTNSIKHAFPDNRSGEIKIDIQCHDGNCILKIADNGVGFPDDLDINDVKTLGLQLVTSLTKQLDGTIELDREGAPVLPLNSTNPGVEEKVRILNP